MRFSMKISILFLLGFMLWACFSDSEPEGDLGSLKGSWKSTEDSNIVLDISAACCGGRASLAGMLWMPGGSSALEPQSSVTRDTVMKPDSDSRSIYVSR